MEDRQHFLTQSGTSIPAQVHTFCIKVTFFTKFAERIRLHNSIVKVPKAHAQGPGGGGRLPLIDFRTYFLICQMCFEQATACPPYGFVV
jgi:hypothetical protein